DEGVAAGGEWPAAWGEMAGEGVEQRRLAAAGGPKQADELSGMDVDVDVLEGLDVLVAVRQLGNGDLGVPRAGLEWDQKPTPGKTGKQFSHRPAHAWR